MEADTRNKALILHVSARERWAEKINAALHKTAANAIETGRLLQGAKQELEHGEFQAMIRRDLYCTPRTAQMFMKIAAHPILTEAKHVSLLPPSWATLYELSKLPDETLIEKLNDGTINPNMERKDVAVLLFEEKPKKPKATTRQAKARQSAPPPSENEHADPLEEARAPYVRVLMGLTKNQRTNEIFRLMEIVGVKVGSSR